MNNLIILSSTGSQDLESISLGVAIAVIALLAVTYIMLFYIWHRYYAKCIKNGLEDESMKKSIMEEYKKFLKPIPLKQIKQDTVFEQNNVYNKVLDFDTVTQEVEFKKKKMALSLNIVLACLYLIMIGIFGLGIYSRVTTGMTNYFGESYLVIKTGSMESKNNSNEYLFTYDLNNQIKQYSLIQLDEVDSDKDMTLYDIYAFYDNEGNIIVHRLININNENGVSKYTFRGDANNASADFERNVSIDKVLGRYNGNDNFVLGVCNLYLSSNIGLITIFFAFSAVLFFDIFEAKANIAETERKRILLKQIFPRIVKNYKDEDLNININIEYKQRGQNFKKDYIAVFMDKKGNCDVFENSLTQVMKYDVHEYVDYKYTNYKIFKSLPGVDRNIIFDIDLIDRRGHEVERVLEERKQKYKSNFKYVTSLSGFDKNFAIYFEIYDNRVRK